MVEAASASASPHTDTEGIEAQLFILLNLACGTGNPTYFPQVCLIISFSLPLPCNLENQCRGSGSGIRYIFVLSDPRIRIWDPGWGKIRIRDEHPGSYFRELRNIFWVKILKFFASDPDSGWKYLDPRSGTSYRHPRSATLMKGVNNLLSLDLSPTFGHPASTSPSLSSVYHNKDDQMFLIRRKLPHFRSPSLEIQLMGTERERDELRSIRPLQYLNNRSLGQNLSSTSGQHLIRLAL
jgi:hypothetical protein